VSIALSPEQILALAPDAGSASAGRGLAQPRKWVTLGQAPGIAWGECQGSGKLPYQTAVDLGGPAFKCSCPSRKFPCKHGLGLLLLLQGQAGAFAQGEPPEWVDAWLTGRAKRAEPRPKSAEPVDKAAQERRAARREQQVAAGMSDLERWLHDLVGQGLASARRQPPAFWDSPAARLVDAQAAGAARLVRELGATTGRRGSSSGSGGSTC
jgi:hypothetical protein